MAPKTTTLRLANLDPKTVAEEVQASIVSHVERLFHLGGLPSHRLEPNPFEAPGTLALSVCDLVEYAQTGQSDVDLPWPEFAGELLALHSTPVTSAQIDGFHNAATPDTPLGLAVLAAYGRHLLATGSPVEARHMYTLASLSKSSFSQLVAAGDIPPSQTDSRPAQWTGTVARRWLKARAVPGI